MLSTLDHELDVTQMEESFKYLDLDGVYIPCVHQISMFSKRYVNQFDASSYV